MLTLNPSQAERRTVPRAITTQHLRPRRLAGTEAAIHSGIDHDGTRARDAETDVAKQHGGRGAPRPGTGRGRVRRPGADHRPRNWPLVTPSVGSGTGSGRRFVTPTTRIARSTNIAPRTRPRATALAELSRKKRDEGLVVAWISLDENDALERVQRLSGVCVRVRRARPFRTRRRRRVAVSRTAAYQIGTLARALDRHVAPCLLVLDEVDRLPRETVELVQRLVEHGPGNLHFDAGIPIEPGPRLGHAGLRRLRRHRRGQRVPLLASGDRPVLRRQEALATPSTRSKNRPPAGRLR